jgi:hypothetical protein
MGVECGTSGRKERWSVNWTESDQVSHLGTDLAVISKYIVKMGSVGVE